MRPPLRVLVPAAAILVAAIAAWFIAGGDAGFVVLAIGWGLLIVDHARHLDAFSRWAEGHDDEAVPEGRGAWLAPMSALYRRVRRTRAHERDLAHTIERFRSAAEAIPDGMVVLDAAHHIKWSSRRAQSLLGLDPVQDEGAPLVNLVRQPEFVRYLESGDHDEAVLVPSNRDPVVMLAMQIVPFGVDEKLLIARDVTQVEAAARMRRDFIANVSHELKTPLTVVSGFLETLQEIDLDARQRTRFLQLMHDQASSMKRLVEDLLTLSSLESEHNPVGDEPLAIVSLLLSVSADAKGLSHGQHEISLDIRDAATVIGSREELASAFGNLVSNAIRYTPAGV